MTRTYRFLGGLSLGYVSIALMTIVGLWLTPFLLTRIGTHEYGLWLITTQVLGYLALMDFGVVALAPREVAYSTGRTLSGSADKVAETLGRFYAVVRWQVPLTAVVCLVAWWAISRRSEELQWPLALILAAFVVTFPLRLYQASLQGLQDLAFLGKVQLTAWIAGTALTIALVFGGAGLFALAAGWVVTQSAVVVACALRLRRRFVSAWRVESGHVGWPAARDLFKRSGWISFAQVGQVFLNGSDILVLGSILGPAATVPYACTAKLVTVLSNHPQLLMQTAAPAIAEMRTSASRDRLTAVVTALARAMLIISGAVACLVLAANQAFVSWWVGPGLFAGMRLTILLIAAMVVRHFATTMIYTLFSFGYERRLSLTALCDGCVTIGVTAALAVYGSLGLVSAPIGSLAGVLLVTLPACASALARELQISVRQLIASTGSWVTRFAMVATVSLLGGRFLDAPGVAALLVAVVAVGVLYGVSMWPLVMQPPLGAYVRSGLFSLTGLWVERSPAVDPRP